MVSYPLPTPVAPFSIFILSRDYLLVGIKAMYAVDSRPREF
jgi:hypothetical protein